MTRIANSFGIKFTFDGNLLKKFTQNPKANFIKKKNSSLELHTFRFLEHCGPDNDDFLITGLNHIFHTGDPTVL